MSLLPHALSQSVSERLGRAVARTGLTPNTLTIIGLCGMGGAGYLASRGWFWQAGVAMLAAGAFDLFDGAVARATGKATTWGAIFDAVSDRLADFAILFGLLFWFLGEERFNREAIILIMLSLSGSMLVSYTRSKAAEYGVRIRSGLGTRLERVLIMAIGLLAGPGARGALATRGPVESHGVAALGDDLAGHSTACGGRDAADSRRRAPLSGGPVRRKFVRPSRR